MEFKVQAAKSFEDIKTPALIVGVYQDQVLGVAAEAVEKASKNAIIPLLDKEFKANLGSHLVLRGLDGITAKVLPGCVWVLSVREPTRTVSDTLWGLVHRKADCTSRRVYSTFMDSILYNGIRGFIYYYLQIAIRSDVSGQTNEPTWRTSIFILSPQCREIKFVLLRPRLECDSARLETGYVWVGPTGDPIRLKDSHLSLLSPLSEE